MNSNFSANLSNDYFTNRQDRYFMIEDCKELCDFYSELVEKVGEFSFRLMPDGSAVPSSVECNPLKSPAKQFNESAAGKIRSLFQTEIIKRSILVSLQKVSFFTLNSKKFSFL